jgi:hypothetical protein
MTAISMQSSACRRFKPLLHMMSNPGRVFWKA